MTFCEQTPRLPSVRQYAEPRPRSCALVSNVYLLLDYGDFTDNTADSKSAPYVQLLSTTNPAEAHADFVATRLNGKDSTNSTSTHHSTSTSSGSGSNGFFQKYRIPIFAAAAVAGISALTGAVLLVKRRRRPVYRPLYDPAPVGDMPLHHVAGYGGPAPYSDPWTSRT